MIHQLRPPGRAALLRGTAALAALIATVVVTLWATEHPALAADKKPAAAPPPVAVTTVPVQARGVPIYRAGIGTVTPAMSVVVRSRIDGQLDSVGYTEGQDVKAGQVLAKLDPRTQQAQVAQAQAQKAKDQATLANARADLQRYTALIAEDAATRQQLDTQKALVAQLEATVQADDALIKTAQVQLSFTTITAPISGRVGARLVDPGNIVHASDATGLVIINQVDPITVVFTLPEEAFQDVNRALNGSREPLAVEAYPRNGTELLGTGKLVLLNNQIDSASGTVQMKARFANPKHTLWPGQFVNMRLVLGQRDQALVVPASAVQRSQDGTYVYVIEPGSNAARNTAVHVVQIQDGIAIIDKGLQAGQRVVTDGQYKLKPGVIVVEAGRGKAGPGKGGAATGGAAASAAASAPAPGASAGEAK